MANSSVRTSPGHFPALLGATAAGLCAALAVVVVVLFALSGAGLADVRAQVAELLIERGAPRHEPGGQRADVGAVAAEANARLHAFVRDAGVGAILAGDTAVQARFNTGAQFGRHVVMLMGRYHGETGWRGRKA
jgi:hypothetical protein